MTRLRMGQLTPMDTMADKSHRRHASEAIDAFQHASHGMLLELSLPDLAMTTTAAVSDKGQVTLPKPVRDRLGIRPGSRLEFALGEGGILQVRVLAEGSAGLAGLLARPGQAARSLSDHEAAISEAVRARARGRR